MQLPVTVQLHPSRALALALGAAHGLAAAGLIPVALPLAAKAGLWAVLALSLGWALRRPEFSTLTLKADGRVLLTRRDGASLEAAVHPASSVFGSLAILVVVADGRLQALPLSRDAVGTGAHRQLRLWLKWKAGSTAA